MDEESFQKFRRELNNMTKKQLVERELAKHGYAMETHSCMNCEYFKIWGTDYSQYYDCTFDKDYRQLSPENIEQNRCLHYKKMPINTCKVCGDPGMHKCLVFVQSPYQPDEQVPGTGYWCDQCKIRYVVDNGTFRPNNSPPISLATCKPL